MRSKEMDSMQSREVLITLNTPIANCLSLKGYAFFPLNEIWENYVQKVKFLNFYHCDYDTDVQINVDIITYIE